MDPQTTANPAPASSARRTRSSPPPIPPRPRFNSDPFSSSTTSPPLTINRHSSTPTTARSLAPPPLPFSLTIRKSPRHLYISTASLDLNHDVSVLCVHLSPPTATSQSKTLLNAQFSTLTPSDLAMYNDLPPFPVYGILGVTHMGSDDVFLGLIVDAEPVASVDDSRIMKITQVCFVSLSNDLYDNTSVGPRQSVSEEDAPINASYSPPNGSGSLSPVNHPCDQLSRLLTSGLFYFSISNSNQPPLDLSRTTQYRFTTSNPVPDDQYIWNAFLLNPLLPIIRNMQAFDEEVKPGVLNMLVPVIHGYVGKYTVGQQSLAVISRMSSNRAGTRYNTRGIDDTGAVANFVETEMVYTTPRELLSYVQVRGSVPVFWDQQGLQVMGHKIQISRARDATRPAFLRHFNSLMTTYGHVSAINLVAQDASSEGVLASEYQAQFKALDPGPTFRVRLVDFDFHAETKGNNYAALSRLMNLVSNDLVDNSCFLMDLGSNQILLRQQGIFRVNCVDCLDRTNVVLGLLADHAMRKFVNGIPTQFQDEFKDLWANNGDSISRIYAGTGALKSGFTRSGKRTIAGFLDDSVKSVGRFVINNFQDKSRQETIDAMLGKINAREIAIHDPVFEAIRKQVYDRSNEFMSMKQIHIHVGTYNVNGKLPHEPIDAWLQVPGSNTSPHLFAIGFQEIVELTPGQIVSADPMKRQMWQQELVTAIRRCFGSEYILVCDAQLVGAAVLIYARSGLTEHIHSVETCIVKTGLGGMAGNKGGLAVTLTVYDTPICFVTAHFAAGQSSVDDRNRDYATIMNEVVFKRGRTIAKDHDHIIWFGDFNYRIDLDNPTVRHLIHHDKLEDLCKRDQLTLHRHAGRTFMGFHEGALNFPPTYKFDNGTHNYDTSEKSRIPGWCDRILYKSHKVSKAAVFSPAGYRALELVHYNRAELTVSDHKPVCALFRAHMARIDRGRKHALYQALTGHSSRAAAHRTESMGQPAGVQPRKQQADVVDLISLSEDLPAPVAYSVQSNPWIVQDQRNKAAGQGIHDARAKLEVAHVSAPQQQQSNNNNWNLLD